MNPMVKPSRHVVCWADEIAPGEAKQVLVDRRTIAIFNVNGEFSAISDRCPHGGASLCRGKVAGIAQADEPGECRVDRVNEFVRCPWHGWEFDLKTGQSWCDPARTRVRKYDISVEQGKGLAEGPYRIDIFDVSQEGDYVVILL